MSTWMSVVAIGAGATALTDLWTVVRARLFRVPPFDYALLGRWLGHALRGRVRHDRIAAAAPLRHERIAGWVFHYAVGVAFAAALVAIAPAWARAPSPGLALLFGLATAAAPFFVLQPALGAGVAARATPRPNAARAQTLVTHAVFGLGLFAAGAIVRLLPA